MARPPKWRCIRFAPDITLFKPAGISPMLHGEVVISLEELEAIRLKDLEGLEQEKCANSMRVSRTTFHRILWSARQKLADALVNGKAIRIEGGNYGPAEQRYRCNEDQTEWRVPFETMVNNPPETCPTCNSPHIQPIPPFGFGRGRGHGRRRGRY